MTALGGSTAVIDEKVTWYAARASGLLAWALITAAIVLGLILSTRVIRRRGAPAWLLDMHKFLGTLSLVFVAVHLLAIWADNFVHFGAADLLVPMASAWRPGAVAWGITALYLLLAIQVTSWFMRRLPRRVWHTIHLSSFLLFISATVHGFTAGADRGNLAVQWIALTAGLLVLFLTAFRATAERRVSTSTRFLRAERRPRPAWSSRRHPAGRSASAEPLVPR
jgi:hypothetical protein